MSNMDKNKNIYSVNSCFPKERLTLSPLSISQHPRCAFTRNCFVQIS